MESGIYHPNEKDGTCGKYLGSLGQEIGSRRKRAVGGTNALRGEFSYQAALGDRRRNKIIYICGGTLINRQVLLS